MEKKIKNISNLITKFTSFTKVIHKIEYSLGGLENLRYKNNYNEKVKTQNKCKNRLDNY